MKRRFQDRAIAIVTLASFLAGTAPRPALAQQAERAHPVDEPEAPKPEAVAKPAADAPAPDETSPAKERTVAAPRKPVVDPQAAPADDPLTPRVDPSILRAPINPRPTPASPVPASLPNGVDATGVSSQVLSLPQGAGKVQGMGESFSNQLSTGTATYSIPISLPGARGGADPSLALSYSTSGGHGVAGAGWDLSVPFIARQTDRGNPLYEDPGQGGGWTPTQDRFVFNGGQELVPICLVTGTTCAGAQPGEVMPSWSSEWQYFRPRIEGSFLRFFWSPDHHTWRVQDKSGTSMELGLPLDGTSSIGTLETDPDDPSRVFRWNLSRQYDAEGAANPGAGVTPLPVNVTRYLYLVDGGLSYLCDVYDTPPAANAAAADVSTYAHHAHLTYQSRPDVTASYRRGWVTDQGMRLTGIDVTSKTTLGGVAGPRRLVRRYHLAYDPGYHVSLLTSVQVEGRCGAPGAGEENEPAESGTGTLSPTTGCPTLPAMTFAYTHVVPYHSDGSSGVADLAGYEGFDERVTTMAASPPHSVDEQYTDLFDINADGLPDVLVTMPGLYGGKHGIYLNATSGQANTFSASTMGVQGVLGETTTTISLDNQNVSSGDLDGDGIIDLVHMPQVKTYSVYTPQLFGTSWAWQGRAVTTASQQSPKINLGQDGLDVQRMDVNGDGLTDVVVSTGTEMETFLSLGRYPGGDGQFGNAYWTGPTTAMISNDPIASCVPWDGLPVQLSDSTIKVADFNGDGLPDIARVQQGNVHYWPGRGNGFWGTGSASACKGGTFGENQSIAMASSPQYADPNGSALRFDDVNGDGLDDIVEVNFTTVSIWLNVDGTGWTQRHIIQNAPASPAYQNRVRLVDVNGSGTRDILWGDAGAYRFMDLSGGARPWLLNHVENGLGKSTDIDYASSTQLMLADAAAGNQWATFAPMPLHVVTQMIVSDNLPVAGNPAGEYITQYSYRDPVYDGRQREFRGFAMARERKIGDQNSPTSNSESQFLLGLCADDEPLAGLPSTCTPAGRWRDNPREALKGLPVSVQSFDDNGANAVYQATVHHTYRLRKLYAGLDGREVRHSYASSTDTYLYDTASGDRATPPPMTTSDVELELTPPPYSAAEDQSPVSSVATQQSGTMLLHGASGRAHLHTQGEVDVLGNTYHSIDSGCVEGCGVPDEVITQFTQPIEVSGNAGWTFRTGLSYTRGAIDPTTRHVQTFSYYPTGLPQATNDVVQGTLPLVRPASGAPPPPLASKDGTFQSVYVQYDSFGNQVATTEPNDRCRSTTFDGEYRALPLTDTVYTGVPVNGCGATALTSSATYDRGLGAILSLTDVHQEQTTLRLDGFGRIVATFRPDPTTGAAGSVASMIVDYQLPANARTTPYSRIHTQTQDGNNPSVASYRESWAYVDGLGRTVVALDEADANADGSPWVASGVTAYDGKGAAKRAYHQFFYSGDPAAFPLTNAMTEPYARQMYDAFGRTVETRGLDGAVSLETFYHALSVDAWDAADLSAGAHYGSYATTTKDGHGRGVGVTERNHVNGKLESYQTTTQYLSTGELLAITRTNLVTGAQLTRWTRHDTMGRMVANVESDTSVNFVANPNPSGPAFSAIASWRYAYNDNGDLVGTSDARGCGANYAYDAGGRIVGEDYSPCTSDQARYSPVVGTIGYEVTYHYDTADPAVSAGIPGFPVNSAVNSTWYLGRLAALVDRSGKSVTAYDGRGRAIGVARQLVAPNATLAPRWYVQSNAYDAADRPASETTGAADSGATELDITSVVNTTYSRRGLVWSVRSDHGALITQVKHEADGLPREVVYGDAAGTTTAMAYDQRRRLSSVQTYRGPPAIWSSPPTNYVPAPTYGAAPTTFQLLLQDVDYKYDVVNNPIEIDDYRIPSEWPAGAQPVTRTMAYDDQHRLTQIGYWYPKNVADLWTSPFAAEDAGKDASPQRVAPSPRVKFGKRVQAQSYAYDWLGNTSATGDDVGGFYDRSLGTVTNGTAMAGPYQLQSATNAAPGAGGPASKGNLNAAYDAAGNMTGLSVARSGACLPAGAVCSQRYAYSWDEVGRLARARRWDLTTPGSASGPLPITAPAADLQYLYDAMDDRAIKAASDATGNVRYALYPADALELRGASWDAPGGDYARTTETQVPYLFAHGMRLGRIATAEDDEPSLTSGAVHLFLEIADHLGSMTILIDRDTGELVEEAAYQAYGAAENDYRPERWRAFREDYRFTGKEEDTELGLHYFGKRYYAPNIGRWMSPDPLTIHGLSADPNAYAYVHGSVLSATDPRGLDEQRFWNSLLVQTTRTVIRNLASFKQALAEDLERVRPSRSSEAKQAVKSVARGDYVGAAEHAGNVVFLGGGEGGTIARQQVEHIAQLPRTVIESAKATRSEFKQAVTATDDGEAAEHTLGVVKAAGAATLAVAEAVDGVRALKAGTPRLTRIPSVRNGAFANWFNSASTAEFGKAWANPALREAIEVRLRSPGGMHEWLLVSRADVFKGWGVTAEQIAELRTATEDVRFVNPAGTHGAFGSNTAHNELLSIIDSSSSYDQFVQGLQGWAANRLDGGAAALPAGLRPK